MKKTELKIQKTMTANEIAKIFSDISDSLQKEKICLINGNEFITLTPSEQMDIELKAFQKKEKQKLTIEITWKDMPSDPGSQKKLIITAEEPQSEENKPEDAETE